MWGSRLNCSAIRKRVSSSFFSSSSSSCSWPSISPYSEHLESVNYLGLDLPDSDAWTNVVHPQPSHKTHTMVQAVDKRGAIIDGRSIGAMIKSQVACEISRMRDTIGKCPGLAIVLVGERNDSHSFVHIKMKACNEVGIASSTVELPGDCTEDDILRVVLSLNKDPAVHGIIVQLPLPKHLDEERVLNVVSPEKDVDGFHPLNMGSLAMGGRRPFFIPCAAKGCIELLLRCGVEMLGKNAVVIGRSKFVGLPVSLLLQRHHGTVSVIDSFTKNPHELTQKADIVIADVGVPNMIRGNWLKQGAVVIDAGTTAVKDPNKKHRLRINGDVCFEEAVQVASAITPVPGGLGPVTISMLLANTLESTKRANGFV